MKPCRACHSTLDVGIASQSFPNIEKLLKFHGFVPTMIPQVALSVGPMCDKCLKAWAKDLRSN